MRSSTRRSSRLMVTSVVLTIICIVGFCAVMGRSQRNPERELPSIGQDEDRTHSSVKEVRADNNKSLPWKPANSCPELGVRRVQPAPFKVEHMSIENLEVTLYAANQTVPTDSSDWFYTISGPARITDGQVDETTHEVAFTLNPTVSESIRQRAQERLLPRYRAAGRTIQREDIRIEPMPLRNLQMTVFAGSLQIPVQTPKWPSGGFIDIREPIRFRAAAPSDVAFATLQRTLMKDPTSVHVYLTGHHTLEFFVGVFGSAEQFQALFTDALESVVPQAGQSTKEMIVSAKVRDLIHNKLRTTMSHHIERIGAMDEYLPPLLDQLSRNQAGFKPMTVDELLALSDGQLVYGVGAGRRDSTPDRLSGKTFQTESFQK